jgi:hypothetical protein
MTYQILTLILNWAKDGAASKNNGIRYREALAELAIAIKRVMKFL